MTNQDKIRAIDYNPWRGFSYFQRGVAGTFKRALSVIQNAGSQPGKDGSREKSSGRQDKESGKGDADACRGLLPSICHIESVFLSIMF